MLDRLPATNAVWVAGAAHAYSQCAATTSKASSDRANSAADSRNTALCVGVRAGWSSQSKEGMYGSLRR